MKFFRKSKITVGLDVGTHSIKTVQLLKNGSSDIRLLGLGMTEINCREDNQFDATLLALKSALKDCNVRRSRVVTSLGGSSTVVKQVSFPTASAKEIASSLKWEANQHIPVPLDTVELTFQIRKVSKGEKTSEVLLVAVNKEHLQNHISMLRQVEVDPRIIDVNPLALANAYLALTRNVPEKNVALLDIGASNTTIIIFRKGGFFFTRDISIAGNRFATEIRNAYHLENAQAELFKKEQRIDIALFKTTLQQLLLEIRQSLLFYDTKTGNDGYEEIVLSGGGAKLSGLSTYLEQNLNLPVIKFMPLQHTKVVEALSMHEAESMELHMGVAMGLALRG